MGESEQQIASTSDIKKKTIDLILDRASKIFAIAGGLAMVLVTYHFSDVASQLSQQSIEVTQSQRKFSIQPALEVLSGINYTEDFDEIIVPIRNYGSGPAIGVRALVAYDGAIRGIGHHLFVTATEELGSSRKVLQNQPGAQQDYFTVGEREGKAWIAPSETVQFQFNPWLDIDRPQDNRQIFPRREFTIFLSFFDVDRNEYLTIARTPIGGSSALISFAGGQSALNDSLMSLSKGVNLFTSRTYDDIQLRSKTGWFKQISEDKPDTDGVSQP